MTQIFVVCGYEYEDSWPVKAFVDKTMAEDFVEALNTKRIELEEKIDDLNKKFGEPDGNCDNDDDDDYFRQLKAITDTHMDPRFSECTWGYNVWTTKLEDKQ